MGTPSRHPIYQAWYHMMRRCYNPKQQFFHLYGGRGIRVCKRWHTFENFAEDMLPSWQKGLSLDRRNNDKGYYLSNCRWVDQITQNRNRSNYNKLYESPWGLKCVSEIAELMGTSHQTMRRRFRKDPPETWFLPVKKRTKKNAITKN